MNAGLVVSQPGDEFERAADWAADQVIRAPASDVSHDPTIVQAAGDMEGFLWSRPAFASAVAALFAGATPALNLDYEFWIHMAVLWLFEKHTPGRSWADTVRAYNGSGARAAHYRQAIEHRASDAAAAAATGRGFVPSGI